MNECCSTDRGRLTIAEERRQRLLADADGNRRPRRDGSSSRLTGWAIVVLLIFVALALLSTGCASYSAGAAPETPYLEQALAQMPADAIQFAFTDWQRVRSYHGFSGNSQHTSRDERAAYMLDVMQMSQAAAQMDSAQFLFQAENWGWDSTDLLWEAQAHWRWLTESVYLLRFRDDFDFTPLRALLQNRDFTAADHGGHTIHTVPLGHNPDWHFRSNLAHHAIAILPDEKLLIMAPTPDPIHRVIAVRAGVADALLGQRGVNHAVDPLRDQAAVVMQLGASACRRFGRRPATGRRSNLAPYTLLAAGYRYEEERQTDILLFHYAKAEEALADLDGRRAFLESGNSIRRDVSYARQFTLKEATVDGPLIRFRLAPTAALRRSSGWPQTLLGWIQDGDARFAGCSTR